MSVIYLSGFTVPGWLKYNPSTGEHERISYSRISEEVPDLTRKNSDGTYEVVGDYTVGFYGSPEGPVFFCNDQCFPIFDRTYTVEIRRDKPRERHTFVLSKDGKEVLAISYKPNPIFLAAALMGAEEDVDFLDWITTFFDEEYFHNRHTRNFSDFT
jgi:hypothetical protein